MNMETLRGWAYKVRKHKTLIFVDLRTPSGIVQCVIPKKEVSEETWETAKSISQESSLEFRGEFREEPRAPGGKELHVREILIYHIAEVPYPLGKKEQPPDVLMKYRNLALRSPRYQAIMKVRATIMEGFREYLRTHGWVEVSPPIINFTACEGGATLFKLKYFDKDAYLSQSAQLYLEMMCPSLFKVWSLTPSFRAEKSRTRRHLAEFWHLEIEAAWLDMDGLMDVEEEMVKHVIKKVLDTNFQELSFLGVDRSRLEKYIDGKFSRITYTEALEILDSKGIHIEWGEDLGADEEKVLTAEIERPMFVKDYPAKIKPFYVKLTGENNEIGLSADLMAPAYGEISTGGVREDDLNILVQRIKESGFDPADYDWYLDLRRYGSVPHAGCGFGIERFVQWLLGLDHIRDTIPVPRMARVSNVRL